MKRIICLILSAAMLLALIPQLSPSASAEKVTADALNIRAEPNTNCDIKGQLSKGDQVTILETKDVDGYTWGRIEKGWIRLDYTDYVSASVGWVSSGGKWYYYGSDGKAKTGWLLSYGNWYYLNSNGVMQTGWLKDGLNWYYLDANGVMQTGWQQLDGTWYYFATGGAMRTGWMKMYNNWYYFKSDGAMVTGTVTIDGKANAFTDSGIWIGETEQHGWVQEGSKRYYFQNGIQTTGWLKLENKWYYFGTDGSMSVGKVKIGDEVHKFDKDGVWLGESDYYVSDDCMRILKAEEGFSPYPYWDYSQWTVGYGTRCPDELLDQYKENGIKEEEAELLLRLHMMETETSIESSYINKYGLTLNQGQYDALVLFSYNCGTGWVYDTTDTLHNAVKNNATGNDIIRAFGLWCNAGGSFLDVLMRRRLCESNMYLNGLYSTKAPENYCYVRFDANGGSTYPRVQAYDSKLTAKIFTKPQLEGSTFSGWFTEKTGGTKVTVLDASVNTKTLYAHWNEGSDEQDEPVAPQQTAVTTGVQVMATDSVNLRKGPGTNYEKLSSPSVANTGDRFTIVETASGSGLEWGRFTEHGSGWICLNYTNFNSVKQQQNRGVWRQESGKWYYYIGSAKVTGWKMIDNKWYYMNNDGIMQTGWVKHANNWYYLNSDGAMQTGWVLLGKTWYYMNRDGIMQTGWVKYANNWYYLNSDGAMQTGWVLLGKTWYYMNNDGIMVTGKQIIDGKEYHFNNDGVWIQ